MVENDTYSNLQLNWFCKNIRKIKTRTTFVRAARKKTFLIEKNNKSKNMNVDESWRKQFQRLYRTFWVSAGADERVLFGSVAIGWVMTLFLCVCCFVLPLLLSLGGFFFEIKILNCSNISKKKTHTKAFWFCLLLASQCCQRKKALSALVLQRLSQTTTAAAFHFSGGELVEEPEAVSLRVATYNLWNYNPLWSVRRARIAEMIDELQPDLLAVQEVRQRTNDTPHQLQELLRETKVARFRHVLFAPAAELEGYVFEQYRSTTPRPKQ